MTDAKTKRSRLMSRMAQEHIAQEHAKLYAALLGKFPASQVWFLTLTYHGARFRAASWDLSPASRSDRLRRSAEGFLQDVDRLHRAIKVSLVNHFDRPSKQHLVPHLHASVDERSAELDGRQYPHLHAVLWLHPDTVERFNLWSLHEGLKSEWASISFGGGVHQQTISPSHDALRRCFSYASKLEARMDGRGEGAGMSRSWPEDYVPSIRRLLS